MEQRTLERPPSLADAVVSHIREGIIRGDYAPGQPLAEASLSEELGTSRGTVREALRELASLGLVDRSIHRGAVVSALTARDAEEIYTLRAALESFAAQLAAERGNLDDDALAMLGRRLAAIEHAAERADVPAMVAADMDFHIALSGLSGHDLLIGHLAAIQVHSRRVLFYSDLYRPTPEIVVRRHRDLYAVLTTGDPYQISLAVDRHVTGPSMDIVERMRAREDPPSRHSPAEQTRGEMLNRREERSR
jgi:DNA-binding GntR family transcriptional regulator